MMTALGELQSFEEERVVACFNVLPHFSPGLSEKNHEKYPRFSLSISQIRVGNHCGRQPIGVTLNTTSLHLRKRGKRQLPTLKIHFAWDITPCQLVIGYCLSMPLPTGSSSPRRIIFLDCLILNIKTLPSLVSSVTAYPSK